MSDLHALLEDAAPSPPQLDVGRIRRRVARRRRRQRLIAGTALAALAGVAASIVSGWPADDTQDVATVVGGEPEAVTGIASSEGGRLFASGSDDDGHYVAEVDPANGSVLWRVEVPAAPTRIAFDLGRIWILGRGVVVSVDPDTREMAVVVDEPGLEATSIGFTDGLAWIADAAQSRLLRVRPGDAATTVELPGVPDDVVVSDDGTVWVRLGEAGEVVGLVLDRPEIAVTAAWTGSLFTGGVNSAVWSTDGERLVEVSLDLLSIGQSAALGRRVPIGGVQHVVRRGDGLVAAADRRVFLLSSGDLDHAGVDDSRALVVGDSAIASLAVVGEDVWYASDAGQLVRLPREAGDASYDVPASAVRGTRIVVRGRADPRRDEELELELGGEIAATVRPDQDGAFVIDLWVVDPTALGAHEIRLGGVRIGAVDVVPAEIGVAYPHALYTHCGVVATHFDGRLWLADPTPEGDWWDEESTPGTLMLEADGTLEFRSARGRSARFVEAAPGTADPIADCE